MHMHLHLHLRLKAYKHTSIHTCITILHFIIHACGGYLFIYIYAICYKHVVICIYGIKSVQNCVVFITLTFTQIWANALVEPPKPLTLFSLDFRANKVR